MKPRARSMRSRRRRPRHHKTRLHYRFHIDHWIAFCNAHGARLATPAELAEI